MDEKTKLEWTQKLFKAGISAGAKMMMYCNHANDPQTPFDSVEISFLDGKRPSLTVYFASYQYDWEYTPEKVYNKLQEMINNKEAEPCLN